MSFELGPKAQAAGYRLVVYDEIGSTSTEALAWATLGDPGRLWVVTRKQVAGHGRRGRPWQTPEGNLAASLLLATAAKAPASATLGFAAGLALEGAIRAVAPLAGQGAALKSADRLALKWPNDVLFDGAKVAGILLEASTQPTGGSAVVIGFGVNVRHSPREIPYPVTALAERGADVSAAQLFMSLAEEWVDLERLWADGHGFALIRTRWLKRAAGLGAPIVINLGEDEQSGTFETIDDEGRLVLRSADGSARAISAGEVHFGAAATASH